MKLLRLEAKRYRSLHDADIGLSGLNVFIGANASGKSTVLDALRFLHEGVRKHDFGDPVFTRGGILHLAWKGEASEHIELKAQFTEENRTFEWSIRLIRDRYEFYVEEQIYELPEGSAPSALLHANRGEGWWSGEKGGRVKLKQSPTACALAAASADASFPARGVAQFVERWGFFDPNPFLLRRDWSGLDSGRFDPYGRNLGETLYRLRRSSPEILEKIVAATQAVVGLPSAIEPRESDDRFYFVQSEPGLQYPVHQMGSSSGTLRMLALMTALFAETEATLIGIEEPENYVHPTALSAFVEHLLKTESRTQFMVTTHSPLLLDFLNEPAAVRVVRRNGEQGTTVEEQKNAEGVRKALDESGFGLGEFYETKGFGVS